MVRLLKYLCTFSGSFGIPLGFVRDSFGVPLGFVCDTIDGSLRTALGIRLKYSHGSFVLRL